MRKLAIAIAILLVASGAASARVQRMNCCAKNGGVCAVQCCNGTVVSGDCTGREAVPPKPTRVSTPVAIYINGFRYETTGVVMNGRTLVPLRGVFETLGAEVGYVKDTGDIFVRYGSRSLILHVNSMAAKSYNDVYYLETPPVIINGTAYVPLRFIAEFLGVHVDWDNTGAVNITSGRHYSEPYYYVW